MQHYTELWRWKRRRKNEEEEEEERETEKKAQKLPYHYLEGLAIEKKYIYNSKSTELLKRIRLICVLIWKLVQRLVTGGEKLGWEECFLFPIVWAWWGNKLSCQL